MSFNGTREREGEREWGRRKKREGGGGGGGKRERERKWAERWTSKEI